MNRDALIRLKDRSLLSAVELAARMDGGTESTADQFNWVELYLRMHKAAVMELHFFQSDKRPGQLSDETLQLAKEGLALVSRGPSRLPIINKAIQEIDCILMGKGGAS